MLDDSMENQHSLTDKRKSPIQFSQTSDSNTNPINEGSVVSKKARISPESLTELKNKPTNFNVEKAVFWEKGERVPFLFMAKALDVISQESDLNVVTDILCNMLRTVFEEATYDDLVAVVYILSERIVPPHVDINIDVNFGVDEAEIVIADACRTEVTRIKKDMKELRDLGLVANERLPLHNKANSLTAVKVFEAFKKLSATYAVVDKKDLLRELLEAATDCEPLYLIRLLQRLLHGGKRLVLEEQTLLTALGHAALYSLENYSPPANVDNPPELEKAAKIVKRVYSVIPVYDKIVADLLQYGLWKLPAVCTITLGIPFGAMLPKHTIGSVSEIFEKFQDKEFICEYEYPGERALIHYMEHGRVEVYGSNTDRNTGKYFDVGFDTARLKKKSVRSFILDCQLVVYDRDNDKIIPSKTWDMCRELNASKLEVHVCVFASDILYLNGKTLLQEPLKDRREVLRESFNTKTGYLQFADSLISTNHEEIGNFLDNSVNSSCPRLIIKTLTEDATYEPAKTSENWLILEKGYVEYIRPSLNLVPIGACPSWDTGEDGYNFLLACYDDKEDKFQSICVIGPLQVSKEILEKHFARLESTEIDNPKTSYIYLQTMVPEAYTWFEPTEVWEVKVDGFYLSRSNPFTIGTVDPIKGIKLLSPSLVGVLGDKNLKNVTTPDEVVDFYKASKHSHIFNYIT